MRSVKVITLLFLVNLACFQTSFGQNDQLFKLWPDSVLAKANSARGVSFLSEEEKQVIYYTNLVRINPRLFAETFLMQYLEEYDIKKDKEIKALIKELEFKAKMNILHPSIDLTNLARKHAKDMGSTGRTGHNSSDGKNFKDRMTEVALVFDGVNENCNYGTEKGLLVFMDLLIDRNVPNYGHRKNILDPAMKFTGVAIEPHKRWGYNCVQDFGGPKL